MKTEPTLRIYKPEETEAEQPAPLKTVKELGVRLRRRAGGGYDALGATRAKCLAWSCVKSATHGVAGRGRMRRSGTRGASLPPAWKQWRNWCRRLKRNGSRSSARG